MSCCTIASLSCFNICVRGVPGSMYDGLGADGRCSIDINSVTTPGGRWQWNVARFTWRSNSFIIFHDENSLHFLPHTSIYVKSSCDDIRNLGYFILMYFLRMKMNIIHIDSPCLIIKKIINETIITYYINNFNYKLNYFVKPGCVAGA